MLTLHDDEYRALAELRYQIRRFLNFSDAAARAAGIDPQQHQLLLALQGLDPAKTPTIGTLAERLQIRHNSAVELVKRGVRRGFIERRTSREDRRAAQLRITRRGKSVLRRLSITHRAEIRSAAPLLATALETLVPRRRTP